GDHIYKMDYGKMLAEHLANRAALTIGAVRIPAAHSRRFGIFQCDDSNRVIGFQEKPEKGAELPGDPGYCLGSMGIYLFETAELVKRLSEDAALGKESSHDFGNDVIPRMIKEVKVQAHHFRAVDDDGGQPYWRDVGTIDAYYEANLDLCSIKPSFNLYDENWPIYTLWHNDPPAKTVFNEPDRKAEVVDSLICPGVVVSGAKVRHSILSNRVFVDEGAVVEGSIVMSGVRIGKNAQVRRAIIDKWTEIADGEVIGHDPARDRERFTVTDSGIVVVPRGADVIRD
ncbi:MAG: glucose-1-phosphate adenylyltransferase, partial [Planctomycetes bacterium]|nr:glucose-1-phosphate adenylyltransferase [Planctomycetota bacterium]